MESARRERARNALTDHRRDAREVFIDASSRHGEHRQTTKASFMHAATRARGRTSTFEPIRKKGGQSIPSESHFQSRLYVRLRLLRQRYQLNKAEVAPSPNHIRRITRLIHLSGSQHPSINDTSSCTAARTLLLNPRLPAPGTRQLACSGNTAYLCLQQVRVIKRHCGYSTPRPQHWTWTIYSSDVDNSSRVPLVDRFWQ